MKTFKHPHLRTQIIIYIQMLLEVYIDLASTLMIDIWMIPRYMIYRFISRQSMPFTAAMPYDHQIKEVC